MEKPLLKDINEIKSPYIIKGIFSYLDIKTKLKMVVYNKKYQNFFGFDIKDYKKLSGIEKVGEKNGKGKEYKLNRNNLIFEGEYLNGKRNGRGYEYNILGKVEFEGEYLNGKKWNVKGYNEKGEITCEIKEGKGLVKEYYFNGELKFEGEYLN